MIGVYIWTDRLAQWHEVTRIPVLDYAVVGLLIGGLR